MKYLQWVLFCIYWYTHKRYNFSLHTTKKNPYVVGITCNNGSSVMIKLTAEQVKQMENNDIALKVFLHQLVEHFWIQYYAVEEGVFEMVRAKDISPLYITFLERYYEEIKENV